MSGAGSRHRRSVTVATTLGRTRLHAQMSDCRRNSRFGRGRRLQNRRRAGFTRDGLCSKTAPASENNSLRHFWEDASCSVGRGCWSRNSHSPAFLWKCGNRGSSVRRRALPMHGRRCSALIHARARGRVLPRAPARARPRLSLSARISSGCLRPQWGPRPAAHRIPGNAECGRLAACCSSGDHILRSRLYGRGRPLGP